MKDKKIKEYARERFSWWVRWLGLGYGDISLEFVEYISDAGSSYIDTDVAGECHTDWRYQETHIYFAMNRLRKLSKKMIEKVVVHELMHVFLNEMREEGIDHEERVATSLQKAFLWIRDSK